MAVLDLFSKRHGAQKKSKDVFSYDGIPQQVRIQIQHVWTEVIGAGKRYHGGENVWSYLVRILRKEFGVFALNDTPFQQPDVELINYFVNCPDRPALDILEVVCKTIDEICREHLYEFRQQRTEEIADEGIQEINDRLREAAIGYEYTNGQLIRVDSQFMHSQAVLPALTALNLKSIYSGAESEFLKAHQHYRKNESSDVLIECCKAFESIMKAICLKRGWKFDTNKDTASKLVDICFANGLIPTYWQTHFGGLRSVLESALPTPRNRSGGHGSGAAPNVVPVELARYVLHMTAATLLFLAEAENKLP